MRARGFERDTGDEVVGARGQLATIGSGQSLCGSWARWGARSKAEAHDDYLLEGRD